MRTSSLPTMSGLRKASILMVALGADASSTVFQHLSQEEVEKLTWEIARIQEVEPSLSQGVVEEFFQRLDSDDYVERAGIGYIQEVLEMALGSEKSKEILGRLARRPSSRPFETIRSLDPAQLVHIVQGEHPQTIALIISHLPTLSAATILSGLPSALQAEVAFRIANMDVTTPDVIERIEKVIAGRLSTVVAQDITSVGGTHALVEILNQVDRSTERTIMEGLTNENPALAETIKERMFVFEDVANLDNRTIQVVLREVEQDDLRLALKGVSEKIREVVYRNISVRAAETLREDVELMGPVRVRDVEAARKKIVAIVRRLEEAGELSTRRTEEDQIIE